MNASKDEEDAFLLADEQPVKPKQSPRTLTARSCIIHFLICCLYIVAVTLFTYSKTPVNTCLTQSFESENLELYSPALPAIHHHLSTIDLNAGSSEFSLNPFVGDPRPELDDAWDALLENFHIRVTPAEFARLQPQLNRSSLRFPNGGDYILRLGVYHELHCLKWIRKWIHKDHYWAYLKGDALEERRWHIEHCLEHFRLQTMATASLAPATLHFGFHNGSRTLEVNGRYIVKAVDWDELQAWTSKRRVDLAAIDWSTLLPE